MLIKTKKFIIPLFKQAVRAPSKPTFFQLARRSIVKKKKGANRDLSANVDRIVYGT